MPSTWLQDAVLCMKHICRSWTAGFPHGIPCTFMMDKLWNIRCMTNFLLSLCWLGHHSILMSKLSFQFLAGSWHYHIFCTQLRERDAADWSLSYRQQLDFNCSFCFFWQWNPISLKIESYKSGSIAGGSTRLSFLCTREAILAPPMQLS